MIIRFVMVQKKKIGMRSSDNNACGSRLSGCFAQDNKIESMNAMSTRNLNDAVTTTQGEDRHAKSTNRDNVN